MSVRESLYSKGSNNISAYTLMGMNERKAVSKLNRGESLNSDETITVYNPKTGRTGTVTYSKTKQTPTLATIPTQEEKPIFTVATAMDIQKKPIDLSKANDVQVFRDKGGSIIGISEPIGGSRAITAIPGYKPGMILSDEGLLQYKKELAASRMSQEEQNFKQLRNDTVSNFTVQKSSTYQKIKGAFNLGIEQAKTAGGLVPELPAIRKKISGAILSPQNIFYWHAKMELAKTEIKLSNYNKVGTPVKNYLVAKDFLLKFSTRFQEDIAKNPAKAPLIIGSGYFYTKGMGLFGKAGPVIDTMAGVGFGGLAVGQIATSNDKIGSLADITREFGYFKLGAGMARPVRPVEVNTEFIEKKTKPTNDYMLNINRKEYSSPPINTKLTEQTRIRIGDIGLLQSSKTSYGVLKISDYGFLKKTNNIGSLTIERLSRAEPIRPVNELEYSPLRDLAKTTQPKPRPNTIQPELSLSLNTKPNLLNAQTLEKLPGETMFKLLPIPKRTFASVFTGASVSFYSEQTGTKILEIFHSKPKSIKKVNEFIQKPTPLIKTFRGVESGRGQGQILLTKQVTRQKTAQIYKLRPLIKSKSELKYETKLLQSQKQSQKQDYKLLTGLNQSQVLTQKQAFRNSLFSIQRQSLQSILGQEQLSKFKQGQELKQEQLFKFKQKQKLKQEQKMILGYKLKFDSKFGTRMAQKEEQIFRSDIKLKPTPEITEIKITKIKTIDEDKPFKNLKFNPRGFFNRGSLIPKTTVKFRGGYTPSLEADIFGIKGTPNKIATESGLGIRPILK
jgi:hypothetical protein